MKECIEKMKKEYTAPQMEVMDCAVQSILCQSSGDVIHEDCNDKPLLLRGVSA